MFDINLLLIGRFDRVRLAKKTNKREVHRDD